MTCDMADTDRLIVLLDECRNLGVSVRPPDVNTGGVGFRSRRGRDHVRPRGDQERGRTGDRVGRRGEAPRALRRSLRLLRAGRSAPREPARRREPDPERRHGRSPRDEGRENCDPSTACFPAPSGGRARGARAGISRLLRGSLLGRRRSPRGRAADWDESTRLLRERNRSDSTSAGIRSTATRRCSEGSSASTA